MAKLEIKPANFLASIPAAIADVAAIDLRGRNLQQVGELAELLHRHLPILSGEDINRLLVFGKEHLFHFATPLAIGPLAEIPTRYVLEKYIREDAPALLQWMKEHPRMVLAAAMFAGFSLVEPVQALHHTGTPEWMDVLGNAVSSAGYYFAPMVITMLNDMRKGRVSQSRIEEVLEDLNSSMPVQVMQQALLKQESVAGEGRNLEGK